MENKINVDELILGLAVRYALTRQSYISTVVVENFKSNINNISNNQLILTIKDIKQNEYVNGYSVIDDRCWSNFLEYLQENASQRGIFKK